ncbi:hypothetical protein Tco_0093320 [Tanacetum coccineum]
MLLRVSGILLGIADIVLDASRIIVMVPFARCSQYCSGLADIAPANISPGEADTSKELMNARASRYCSTGRGGPKGVLEASRKPDGCLSYRC